MGTNQQKLVSNEIKALTEENKQLHEKLKLALSSHALKQKDAQDMFDQISTAITLPPEKALALINEVHSKYYYVYCFSKDD